MILQSSNLVNTLRKKCDNAKKRIWIASPFIGNFKSVERIVGNSWKKTSIEFILITDIDAGFIKKDSFSQFAMNDCNLRTLKSLHAKIYIVDDWALITSANLTGTAFSSRYEVGIEITNNGDFKDLEKYFCDLYEKSNVVTKFISSKTQTIDYQDGNSFDKICNLPHPPSKENGKYFTNLAQYKKFADSYQQVTGRNKKMIKDGFTLYQEIDYMFNYLYHEHPNTPTLRVTKTKKRSNEEIKKMIEKHFFDVSKYYISDKNAKRRIEKSKVVRKNILHSQKMDHTNIENVVNCLHCYNSYPPNKTRFLNSENNDDALIEKYWKNLLNNINDENISLALKNLRFFGNSALRELIGWYFPNQYPIMNTNSDCGMRYFGYQV